MANEIDAKEAEKEGKRTNTDPELKPKDMRRETHAPRGAVGFAGPGGVSPATKLPPAQDARARASAERYAAAKREKAERDAQKVQTRDMVANGKQGRITFLEKDFAKATAREEPKRESKLRSDFRKAASKDGPDKGPR